MNQRVCKIRKAYWFISRNSYVSELFSLSNAIVPEISNRANKQGSYKINVKTRFNSTVDMYESVLQNKSALLKLKQYNWRKPGSRPSEIDLNENRFDSIGPIFKLLVPVRGATVNLSKSIASVCYVTPLFTVVHDSVLTIDVLMMESDLNLHYWKSYH